MKKHLQVIGYQPETLCTREDLEKFDLIWWARKEVEPLKYVYKPSSFRLTEAAKEAFSRGIYFVKLIRL